MTTRLLVLALVLLAGCDSASGTVSGGEALVAEPDSGGGTTWTALYGDFFGPAGKASCSAQATCHATSAGLGAMLSGFVCGATKDDCWSGMTQGISPDAQGTFCPIVCVGNCPQNGEPCNVSDPTQQLLYQDVHKAKASGLNNMPCGGNLQQCPASGATYTFTADDLGRITTWIQQGAQND